MGQARRPPYLPLSHYRVTFVITDLDVGGAERQLVELVTRLPRDEFEPAVLVLFPPPASGELPGRLAQAGVPVEYFRLASKWSVPTALRRLSRRLADDRPDVVQCFLHHANLLGSLAARRAGIHRVVSGIRVAERRWNLHRLTARMMDGYVARHACVSEAVAEFAATSIGLNRSKLVVIPNGVDVPRFAEAEAVAVTDLGLPPGGRILLYVGRLDRQKQVDWLIRRMVDLAGRLPNHHLVLAGQGRQERRLRRLARDVKVADRVHFLGWRSDIPSVLAAADILVFTSAWEGMPNAVLEAMAAGKPIVATNAEGVSELLGPLVAIDTAELGGSREVRQVVELGDARTFVEAVTALVDNACVATSVGRLNQNRATREFALERMVHRYCELYRRLLT